MKEHTAFIQPESDDEDAEDEAKDEDEEDKAAEELVEASKETSQALGNKKGSTSKNLDPKVASAPTIEENVVVDPNAQKFIPGCIHFDRT